MGDGKKQKSEEYIEMKKSDSCVSRNVSYFSCIVPKCTGDHAQTDSRIKIYVIPGRLAYQNKVRCKIFDVLRRYQYIGTKPNKTLKFKICSIRYG